MQATSYRRGKEAFRITKTIGLEFAKPLKSINLILDPNQMTIIIISITLFCVIVGARTINK